MQFRLVPKLMTLDDLKLLQVQIFAEFCSSSHIWEATTAKRMKIDPYCLSATKKCSPVTLVSGNIRRMWIFVGFPWAGRQMTVELSTTAIFGDLGGYIFGNVRDKESNIRCRYATPCRPIIDSKVNDLE